MASKKTVPTKKPLTMSQRATVRWDKEREKRTKKLASKIEAMLVKSKLAPKELALLIAKMAIGSQKTK